MHLPELNTRLNLNLDIPCVPSSSVDNVDPFAPIPNLENKNKIDVIYLGNSMIERLKNTGKDTRLGALESAWNAGVGGDANSNVVGRFEMGMYDMLKRNQGAETGNLYIKLWILASGTNDLHAKHTFRGNELEAYRRILEACLRIAPRSQILACDVFYRKDIPDGIVDEGNGLMEQIVKELNAEVAAEKILWVEARHLIGKEMLVDHVHLDEKGYAAWDEVLWPQVCEILNESID